MRLQPGVDAPRFEMLDVYGNLVRLDDFAGRPVLLSFHRFAACPLCNLRTDELNQYYPIWQTKGLQILMFYQSTRETITRLNRLSDPAPAFPVIADAEKVVYAQYGIENSMIRTIIGAGPWNPRMVNSMLHGYFPARDDDTADRTLLPADILLTPDLKVHTAYYAKTAADGLSVRRISAILDSLHAAAVA